MVTLIFKEILHRKVNFLLSVLAVVTAGALCVVFFTTGEASDRETKRIMRDMGFNLRIIPEKTDMYTFWSTGYSEFTMDKDYVDRFAKLKGFSYTHLVATLQKKTRWQGMDVILTGMLPEVLPLDKRLQKPMTFSVKKGNVYLGFQLAQNLGIKKGDQIDVLGKSLKVKECLSQSGNNDDIRIYGHLEDIQDILNLPGQINEIKALECLCLIESSKVENDMLTVASRELAQVLPNAKVVLIKSIAEVRQKQRAMMQAYLGLIIPFVVVVCGAWIAVLTMINTRKRRQEVGLMRALGYNAGRIGLLFLGKSVVIGLLGAVAGFIAGTALALYFGPDIFKVTAKALKPEYILLKWSLIVAPVFAAVSSFIPVTIAIGRDPADTLREQ